MRAVSNEIRILAIEIIVRRLAQRIIKNHPRAFEDLGPEIEAAGQLDALESQLTDQLSTYTSRLRCR